MRRAAMAAFLLLASGCGTTMRNEVRHGLPETLAIRRTGMIRNVHYLLSLDVRREIRGKVLIRFDLTHGEENVVLDFKSPEKNLLSVSVPYRFRNGHIVFKGRKGPNQVEVEFLSDSPAIHRADDHLYTLFVPDRASEVFPCFDQPDLKARWTLELVHPAGWKAVSNASEMFAADTRTAFQETLPLPTYLFGFAAGRMQVQEGRRGAHVFRMFHLAQDADKVHRNAAEIFDLHSQAFTWMESYTGIPYAFPKPDFILIPGFPFSGMEHPGAVLYRADRILLGEAPTVEERLTRASLIAHETAHMWFGNLVTMQWFDDVWMKESFANFMADKITQPMFPEIDFGLRFLTAHAQPAYAVDRSSGTHPLHQPLANLRDASELYGSIIYHKSPFVLRQLEGVMGESSFRAGMQDYLKEFRFGNALWLELISLLDHRTPADLKGFSRAWVERAGRPVIETHLRTSDGRITELVLSQSGGIWNQSFKVLVGSAAVFDVRMDSARVEIDEARGLPAPAYVIANAEGAGYGRFRLDAQSLGYVVDHLPAFEHAVTRGVLWESLYDAVLEGELSGVEFTRLAIRSLASETEEILVENLIGESGKLTGVFWQFLSSAERSVVAPDLEKTLVDRMAVKRSSLRTAILKGYRRLAYTPEGVKRLEFYWNAEGADIRYLAFDLSERDMMDMAFELALAKPEGQEELLARQALAVKDPELRARLDFLQPAASPDISVRDAFFASLQDPANRRKEPWVIDGLKLIHHPRRRPSAEKYIRPSLALLEEIRTTGDIFFPVQWLSAALKTHNTPAARLIVEEYLRENRGLPPHLHRKVLAAADSLFRASQER